MSSVRTLKIRRSGVDNEPAEQVNDLVLGRSAAPSSVRSVEKSGTTTPPTPAPMEVPFDRQCIIRFPIDIAEMVAKILPQANDTSEILRISLDKELVNGHSFRAYTVTILGTNKEPMPELAMKGILVDLPTFVESYKTINKGATVTKSSDISQMMICFKASEFVAPYNPEIQKALNLMYPSGLTPPTNNIRYRKFRLPPSKEDVQNTRSAEDVIDSVMSGGTLEWVVENQVDEDEAVSRAINEPENVWTPSDEILAQLRHAGFINANGDIVGEDTNMADAPPRPPLSFPRR
jgi:hypothetical protein